MEKTIIHRQNASMVTKDGSVRIWASKDVNEQLETLSLDTGFPKEKLTDHLLKQSLKAVKVVDSEF